MDYHSFKGISFRAAICKIGLVGCCLLSMEAKECYHPLKEYKNWVPFRTVYKYWQNLPILVEVSLHLNSFFWVQNFYALFILIWDPFFFFLHLFVFVFILDEHSWHAIDVFVRLPECRFNSALILQPKKLFYFTLVYLEIS